MIHLFLQELFFGEIYYMEKKTPNFFIVGAAKAGTTSLYHYLKSHEDVYFSPVKEPNYFSTDIKTAEFTSIYKRNVDVVPKDFYDKKPEKNVQLSFIRDQKLYLDLFKWVNGESVVGECSTSYLYSKKAAKNIYNFNPDAKIVIVLRNPAERTFSHYLMAVRYGFTRLPFRKALEKDKNQDDKGWGKTELFIELSQYAQQIKRYLDVFPEGNVKIVLFDDFKKDTLKTLNEISEFLGIEKFNDFDKKKYNRASLPKSKNLNSLMVNTGIKQKLAALFGERTKEKLKGVFFQENEVPELGKEDRKYLQRLFKSDIEQTSQIIGRDLSRWLAND